jgi:hypothetical protein
LPAFSRSLAFPRAGRGFLCAPVCHSPPVAHPGRGQPRSVDQLPARRGHRGATAAAGADGWAALKGLVGRLRGARTNPDGNITIREVESGTEILLTPELPDEAYQRLLELEDTRAPRSGILTRDREQRAWVDPLAGHFRCRYPGCVEPATEGRVRQQGPTSIERREYCDIHAAAADLGDERAWAVTPLRPIPRQPTADTLSGCSSGHLAGRLNGQWRRDPVPSQHRRVTPMRLCYVMVRMSTCVVVPVVLVAVMVIG